MHERLEAARRELGVADKVFHQQLAIDADVEVVEDPCAKTRPPRRRSRLPASSVGLVLRSSTAV